MRRAMVLIGVKQAGDLTQLKAVREGIEQMAAWARSQGIDGEDLKILCDDEGPVYVHQIAAAVRELVNTYSVHQLLVYFSGHGIYNNGERWLLSMAPEDPSQAVNVEASMMLARYCNIPHVVFISDACRDPAAGIQMMQVSGSAIFPNGSANEEMPVDAFFACTRGSVAFEVANAADHTAPYTALFTSVLSAALRGEASAVIVTEQEDGKEVGYVRPWQLTDHLREAVPQKLTHMLGMTPRVSQLPGSRITSRNAWLSRLDGPFATNTGGGWKMRGRGESGRKQAPLTVAQFVGRLLPLSLYDFPAWRRALDERHQGAEFMQLKLLISLLFARVERVSPALVVRGAALREVMGRDGVSAMYPGPDPDMTLIDCAGDERVVVVTDAGHGALVPLLPGATTELVFKNGVLLDMRYIAGERTAECRAFRATLAAAFNMGALHLPESTFPAMSVHDACFDDPTAFLYIAYAHHEAQAKCRQAALESFRARRPDLPLFDLELLAGARSPERSLPLTPIPMISQGWNLLSAFDIELPGRLGSLGRHILPSYWTLFSEEGTQQLIAALASGEI